jgi:hypothetical protein
MKFSRAFFGIVVLALMAFALVAEAGSTGWPNATPKATATFTLAHVFTSITDSVKPEPTTLILLGMGGLVLLGIRRRRKAA